MKKRFVLICLLLICSSGLFAKTHHHHHRGTHIYTGETSISAEKVGKIKNICANCLEIYSPDDYVIYKSHAIGFKYSGCLHHGWEVDSIEIIRLAEKDEISEYVTKRILIAIGVLLLAIVVVFGQMTRYK